MAETELIILTLNLFVIYLHVLFGSIFFIIISGGRIFQLKLKLQKIINMDEYLLEQKLDLLGKC